MEEQADSGGTWHATGSLNESEERFRLLIDGVTDYALFMLDANGFVTTWNAGAQRIKGYRAGEIIGQHFRRFYPADAVEGRWPEHELQVATITGRFEEEGWRLRKDGTRFWANVVITALKDRDGRLRGFAKLTRDLTDRHRAESLAAHDAEREALLEAERSARIEAQRVARIKDEFLATLSHELRSPLSAILGWVQVLQSGVSQLPDEVRHGIAVIERNARAQARLIEDLLDLSRIISGHMRLEVHETSLAAVVQRAIEAMELAASAKGVRLTSWFDAGLRPVAVDASRMQQVAWNLLSNAIKFTAEGGHVDVRLEQRGPQIRLSVTDTGIGISAAFLPFVFDRFSQRDSSTTRNHGGLGLGLAISKQLAELHGGTLEASSPGEGQGATFVLSIPVVRPAQTEHPVADPAAATPSPVHPKLLPSLDGVKALIVDDEPDARELLQKILEAHGARVTAAHSGDEALRVIARSPPDVMLCDLGMPGLDGYQVMRKVRETEVPGTTLPAIAVSAFARPEDRSNALLAGYQGHVAKPFDVAELIPLIARVTGRIAAAN